ncbi:MAG: hypothetical protein AB9844_08445 [Clostridiaceae bacterium]
MNKKLKKGLVISAAAMGMGIVLPTVSVMAAPVTANGWVMEGTTWYYYVNGVKLVNAWAQDSKGWCFLGADGAAIKEGWAKDSVGWCYIMNYNWVNHSTWAKDSAGWQFIGTNGYWDPSVPARATNPLEVFEIGSISVVDATHIKVVYTQKVDAETAEDMDNYDFDGLDIDEIELQDDGVTVIISLDQDGDILTNDDDDDYTVKIEGVESAAGKTIADYKEVLNLYDNVRPTVKSLEMTDSDTLTITFSEIIDGADEDSIEIYDEDDNLMDMGAIEMDDNEVTVAGLATDEDTEYKLVVRGGVVDLAGNRISPNPYEDTFTVDEDNTDPEVDSITAVSLTSFKVTFSEELAGDPELEIENGDVDYTLSEQDDDNAYIVTMDTEYDSGDLIKVKVVGGYEDKAGNEGDSYAKYLKIKEIGPELESTDAEYKTLDEIGQDDVKYAIFTFDQDIDNWDYEDLDATYVDNDDSTVITTIDDDLIFTNESGGEIGDYLGADQFAIALNLELAELDGGDFTVTIPEDFAMANGAYSSEVDVDFSVTEDTTDVELDYVESDEAGTVYVQFTDEVGNSALDLNNYEVEGVNVFSKAVFTGAAKDRVKLTVKAGAIKYSDEYEFAAMNIKDADGNEIDDYTEDEFFFETVAPYITKAVVADLDTIVVTFNEVLADVDVDEEDFAIKVDGASVDIVLAEVAADGKRWVLTIASYDEIQDADSVVKAGTSEDFDGVDLVGNDGVANSMKTASWDLDYVMPEMPEMPV